MSGRAFTVASLAAAWDCSEGLVRKLIDRGELGCFRIGTLIRIPAEEVARFECQNIPSSASASDSPSCGEEQAESDTDTGLRPLTALEQRLRRDGFGRAATVIPIGRSG